MAGWSVAGRPSWRSQPAPQPRPGDRQRAVAGSGDWSQRDALHGHQHHLRASADDGGSRPDGRRRARICEPVLVSGLSGPEAEAASSTDAAGFQNRESESRRPRPRDPDAAAGRDRETSSTSLASARRSAARSLPAEAAPEREPRQVVVTAEFWRNCLRGDPAAIGESMVFNGETFTVVGVLPDDYRAVAGWIGPQIYVPVSRLTLPALDDRGTPCLSVLARLQPNTRAARHGTPSPRSWQRSSAPIRSAVGEGQVGTCVRRLRPCNSAVREMGYNAARTLVVRGRRSRAPHRVRQCGWTADGSRDRAAARDCRSRGHWRRARARRAVDARRESAARGHWGSGRVGDGVRLNQLPFPA